MRKLATSIFMAMVVVAGANLAAAAESGDAKKGKRAFFSCKSCHAAVAGKNKIGPTLFAVLGRTAGTEKTFGDKFSKDMKAAGEKGLKWSEETLFEYLRNPKKYVGKLLGKKKARIKMFNKFKSEKKRRDVIAYLKTLK